ncbi:hypothetical protein [Williamsia sterculiae]|uniref:hypothetical protein n=1 Tax=Williamsia sterculiae TaxID=1344003 RepID=UPI00097049FE|nr:hypothetical protein [Williamsia sterculiae]
MLIITELLKLVPVEFTSKYPAWVNGILSTIAAIIVVKPSFDVADVAGTAGTALLIAVVAAVSYNQFASKLVNTTTGTVG